MMKVLRGKRNYEKLKNNPPFTNTQCLIGHQEYPFWTTLKEMKTKGLMKKTLKMIL